MKLSNKQQEAFDTIMHFILNSNDKQFVFSGTAGSGKSTIINELFNILWKLGIKTEFVSFTGKAASVLRSKGIWTAKTIHSLLYFPILDKDEKVIGYQKKTTHKPEEFDGLKLIVVDEASVLNRDINGDLEDCKTKLLFVGDENQLPSFGNDPFNIMEKPDIILNEIHRQAENNPIIKLSQHILEYGNLPRNYTNNDNIVFYKKEDLRKILKERDIDIFLCGTNKKREMMNRFIRGIRGYHEDIPEIGEQVICLRNDTFSGEYICNGEIRTIENIVHGKKQVDYQPIPTYHFNGYDVVIPIRDDSWDGVEPKKGEGLGYFSLGNCITVFKSQGSEFDNVVYIDENVSYFTDQRKFRYTAVTRAKEFIGIIR